VSQLDFFLEAPAEASSSARLMPFPIARRRKLVTKTATALISRKTQEGREKYWGRVVRDLTAELRRYGARPSDIEAQLFAFHGAVGAELAGQHQQPMTPNGAA